MHALEASQKPGHERAKLLIVNGVSVNALRGGIAVGVPRVPLEADERSEYRDSRSRSRVGRSA